MISIPIQLHHKQIVEPVVVVPSDFVLEVENPFWVVDSLQTLQILDLGHLGKKE